jgi:hypothetical protein
MCCIRVGHEMIGVVEVMSACNARISALGAGTQLLPALTYPPLRLPGHKLVIMYVHVSTSYHGGLSS